MKIKQRMVLVSSLEVLSYGFLEEYVTRQGNELFSFHASHLLFPSLWIKGFKNPVAKIRSIQKLRC